MSVTLGQARSALNTFLKKNAEMAASKSNTTKQPLDTALLSKSEQRNRELHPILLDHAEDMRDDGAKRVKVKALLGDAMKTVDGLAKDFELSADTELSPDVLDELMVDSGDPRAASMLALGAHLAAPKTEADAAAFKKSAGSLRSMILDANIMDGVVEVRTNALDSVTNLGAQAKAALKHEFKLEMNVNPFDMPAGGWSITKPKVRGATKLSMAHFSKAGAAVANDGLALAQPSEGRAMATQIENVVRELGPKSQVRYAAATAIADLGEEHGGRVNVGYHIFANVETGHSIGFYARGSSLTSF